MPVTRRAAAGEEREARQPALLEADPGGVIRNPQQRRLVAMRRGEPVDVPGYLLPRSVRDGTGYQSARRGVSREGNPIVRPLTATVWPDGRIVYRPETAREWLENEMPEELDRNASGMPMDQYRLQAPYRQDAR